MLELQQRAFGRLPWPTQGSAEPKVVDRQKLLKSVFALIDRNFRDDFRLTHLGAQLGYDADHLSSLIRSATGRPIKRWITERRLAEARFLLTSSDDPIGSISKSTGYSDSAYFCRAFVRATGQSPSRWRSSRTAGSGGHRGMFDFKDLYGLDEARLAIRSAATLREAEAALLKSAKTLSRLDVMLNHRDISTGSWFHHGTQTVAFRDHMASIPLLLNGCASIEVDLERSYFDYYRHLAQSRMLHGFAKIPIFSRGVCIGALVARAPSIGYVFAEEQYILEQLSGEFGRRVRLFEQSPSARASRLLE